MGECIMKKLLLLLFSLMLSFNSYGGGIDGKGLKIIWKRFSYTEDGTRYIKFDKEKTAELKAASDKIKKIPKDKIVYCHCVSGGRVMPASAILQKIGYDVRPLKPGYKDPLKAGFEKAK